VNFKNDDNKRLFDVKIRFYLQGITMLELMTIVVIIGILSIMSISLYHAYSIRTRVSEGLVLAGPAKIAVSETYQSQNAIPNQSATGFVTPSATNSVSHIRIAEDGSGRIEITYSATVGGGTIFLEPKLAEGNVISWDCTGGTLASQYRPPNCRKQAA
jgi:type IV pilus assembly protein PilA